jgi:sec-independent protein translocase protein TatA
MMFGLGAPELIVVGVIIFVLFGAKRLPDIGKGLGGAIREFRQVKKDLKPEIPPNPALAKGGQGPTSEKGVSDDLTTQLAQKALEQVPGVKQAMDLKDKINKVKDIVQP